MDCIDKKAFRKKAESTSEFDKEPCWSKKAYRLKKFRITNKISETL